MDAELITGLGQVRYVLKSVANGDDQSAVANTCVEIVESAIEALSRPSDEATQADVEHHALCPAAVGVGECSFDCDLSRRTADDEVTVNVSLLSDLFDFLGGQDGAGDLRERLLVELRHHEIAALSSVATPNAQEGGAA